MQEKKTEPSCKTKSTHSFFVSLLFFCTEKVHQLVKWQWNRATVTFITKPPDMVSPKAKSKEGRIYWKSRTKNKLKTKVFKASFSCPQKEDPQDGGHGWDHVRDSGLEKGLISLRDPSYRFINKTGEFIAGSMQSCFRVRSQHWILLQSSRQVSLFFKNKTNN